MPLVAVLKLRELLLVVLRHGLEVGPLGLCEVRQLAMGRLVVRFPMLLRRLGSVDRLQVQRYLRLLGVMVSRLVSRLCLFVVRWLRVVVRILPTGHVVASLEVAPITVAVMGLVVGSLEVAKRVELLVVVAVTVTVVSVLLVGRLGLPVRRWLMARAGLVRRSSQVEVVRLLAMAIGLLWLLLRRLGLPMIVAKVLLERLLVLLLVWLRGCLSRLLLRRWLLLRRLLRLLARLFGGSHGLELLVLRLWLLWSVPLLTRTSMLFHRLIVLFAHRIVLYLSARLGMLRLWFLLLLRAWLGRWINPPHSFLLRFRIPIFIFSVLLLLSLVGLGRFLRFRGWLSIGGRV